MPLISIITPTNGRPEALALCKEFVARQTFTDYEHIVEEGGMLNQNLTAALPKAQGEIIAVFEDDDHYKAGWLQYIVDHMVDDVVLVGESCSNYYHLPSAGHCPMEMRGHPRSSMCSTAFHRSVIPSMEAMCQRGPIGLDARFWAQVSKNPHHLNHGPEYFVTGMKGLPGTQGMGVGHKMNWYKGGLDTDRVILRKWVGEEDAARYLQLLEEWNLG